MSSWRYIVQRATTGEFLEWDLPIEVSGLSWELSGPGALTGTVAPDVGALRADDGDLILQDWASFIYAEADGHIRWGGIVVSSTFSGEEWQIEAAGFSTYPHGIPYDGYFAKIGVDPVDCFRNIWTHLQNQTDGDLGIVITGDSTPVRLGTAAVAPWPEVQIEKEWKREDEVDPALIIPSAKSRLDAEMTKTQTTAALTLLSNYDKLSFPFTISIGNEKIRVTGRTGLTLTGLFRGVDGTTATTHNKDTLVESEGTPKRMSSGIPAEPYRLAWYESPDCGSEIDSLVSETPFDFVERHSWDGEQIRHEIEVGYPRLGRRRDDLAFIEGDNVTSVVTVGARSDDFANVVVGIGAGEGRKTVRETVAVRDGRLRRAHVFSDKSVSTSSRLRNLTSRELDRRRGILQIDSIDIIDHENARIGSWQIGDDILVRAWVPWLGEVAIWSRITGWSLTGDDTATLSLARSDSFTYGG